MRSNVVIPVSRTPVLVCDQDQGVVLGVDRWRKVGSVVCFREQLVRMLAIALAFGTESRGQDVVAVDAHVVGAC